MRNVCVNKFLILSLIFTTGLFEIGCNAMSGNTSIRDRSEDEVEDEPPIVIESPEVIYTFGLTTDLEVLNLGYAPDDDALALNSRRVSPILDNDGFMFSPVFYDPNGAYPINNEALVIKADLLDQFGNVKGTEYLNPLGDFEEESTFIVLTSYGAVSIRYTITVEDENFNGEALIIESTNFLIGFCELEVVEGGISFDLNTTVRSSDFTTAQLELNPLIIIGSENSPECQNLAATVPVIVTFSVVNLTNSTSPDWSIVTPTGNLNADVTWLNSGDDYLFMATVNIPDPHYHDGSMSTSLQINGDSNNNNINLCDPNLDISDVVTYVYNLLLGCYELIITDRE